MAAATYNTDLVTFEDFDNGASTVTEVTGFTATRAFEDQDGDNPIQGTLHASAEQRTANTGSIVVNGTGTTLAAGEAFFIWQNFLQAGAVNTFANAGIVGIVGTGTGAYYRWTVGGSDFGRNPYGGWANLVCDPTITTGRTTQGSPGTSYSIVGYGCDVITPISKGSPYNLDVIRSGRGEVLVTDGDLANGYATFEGIATQNDLLANRWGLFQDQFGTYLWKGLLSLGTTTSVDFRDANRVIVIDNTLIVSSSFNRIEVNNAASNISWDAINISALGTVSRGQFEMIDGATLDFNTCVFTDMDTFIFNKGAGNCSITSSTWRRCNRVTQGGATFNSCIFDATTDSVSLVSTSGTASDINTCVFTGDGTSHAVDLGTVSSSTSITWNSTFDSTTYATTNQASNASSTAGDSEVILVNVASGQTLTIQVTGVASPTYRNTGAGSVNIIAAVNLSITGVLGNSEIRIYNNPSRLTGNSTSTEVAGTEVLAANTVTGSGNGATAVYYSTPSTVQINIAGGNFSALGTLIAGDKVRVTVRDQSQNPKLDKFDVFTVVSATSTSILTDAASAPTTFTNISNSSNSLTVTVEKVGAVFSASLAAGAYDIVVLKVASLPVYFLDQSITADGSIPVSQVQDRVYNNPA